MFFRFHIAMSLREDALDISCISSKGYAARAFLVFVGFV